MPVQILKAESHPAIAQRVAEAEAAIVGMLRALAPVVQKAGEEMGRSLQKIRAQRPSE